MPGHRRAAQPGRGEHGPARRAAVLVERLEAGAPHPLRAAEELDRLQGALERAGGLPAVRERAAALAARWTEGPLRGERVLAWLTLVGAFGMAEQAARAGALALDAALPAAARIAACRVLGSLRAPPATEPLLSVLLSRSEASVRAAAADALAEAGDAAAAPVLDALLEEDLPALLWRAVAAARQRLG